MGLWEVGTLRKMRAVCIGLLLVSLGTAAGAAQTVPCDTPAATAETIPCSESVTAESVARAFLESALQSFGTATPTPRDLAAKLTAQADAVCDQPPERGTRGPLYGLGQWGCENGYSWHMLCENTTYFEKEVDAGYGYIIVYHVVVSTAGWNVPSLIDTTAGVTLKRTSSGDLLLYITISLRTKATVSAAPAGFVEALRAEYNRKAAELKEEIQDYCDLYKKAYCAELRSLAEDLTTASPQAGGLAPGPLSIVTSADKHLATTTQLGVAGDAFRFLVVAGTVTDDRGEPVPNAEVRIPNANVSARTAADGSYRISTFSSGAAVSAQRIDVTLQRATLTLAAKGAVTAVAADGVSRLAIQVTSRGIRSETVSVDAPALGEFERASSGASPLTLDKDGKGTLTYIPPRALPDSVLKSTLSVGTGSAARTVPAAVVNISVRFLDPSGAPQAATLAVKVCRPPTLLVRSYLGGAAPWDGFAAEAGRSGIDCVIVGEGGTWETRDGSLADWAKNLARSIDDAKSAYEKSGIQVGAVDIVAHSASGLLARNLLEGANPRQDVGRLILLGTPNHGIAWLDREIGDATVKWLAAHPTAAADLQEGSTFLRALAPSSASRRASYVNIVGRRAPSLSASRQGSATAQDDGIVSAASSHLDGVPDLRFDEVVHAPGLPLQGTALTESRDVWAKIIDLLKGDMPVAEPDAQQIELERGRQVTIGPSLQSPTGSEPARFPVTIGGSTFVRTGDKGYADISIARAGRVWGSIWLDANAEIIVRASLPDLVRVEVVSGSARLRALEDAAEAGSFEVVLDARARSSTWYESQPDIRTLGVNGDFVVTRGEACSVLALGGTVIVEYSEGTGFSPARLVDRGTGVLVRSGGATEDLDVPARGWWTSSVWQTPVAFFYFPIPILLVSLAGLAVALTYHLRARRRFAPRKGEDNPAGKSA